MAEEGRTKFRKYVATVMAASVIGGVIYAGLTGALTTTAEALTPVEVLFGGVIVGFAAKYLWEENTS